MPGDSDSSSKPSSVACLPCRSRHVKCDAVMPTCTRCRTNATECHYIRSRRGLRKRSKDSLSQPLEENVFSIGADTLPDWLDAALPPDLSVDAAKTFLQPHDGPTIQEFSLLDDALALPETDLVTPEVAYDPMIQLYYENFHPSHPFMIPRKALGTSLCYLIPPPLLSIMRYIGAHYYPNPSLKQEFRQAAFNAASDASIGDGARVQALLLLAIVDHSHCHEQNAHRLIQTAVSLALEIGVNRQCFATEHSYGHSVLEESWRRTYWELYVVEGLLAAMREQSSFRLYHEPVNVQLPCDEKMYNCDNVIPSRQSLDDLQNNWTLGQDFSTFAYRISAVQKLGAVLELNRSLELEGSLESHIETIDAHLVSSLMVLPPLHGTGYDSSCHDEMVFQAQMILYLALTYLHHPRSSMRFASFHANPPTPCTRFQLPETPTEQLSLNHTQALNLHSHKLLRAADHLSALATLPSAIHRRTPFFTCALAMCIIVHTAALLVVESDEKKKEAIKARIQLSIGGLKVLGRTWPLSKVVRGQMVDMYQAVNVGR
ncbi:putative Zn(II)2Cys6 transcription factor [Aspergillus mulundensis]|uniref:Putative Zn(II)2Cys6 transcription factor n=1 Tax=Aspergillus mulundensis TaxID=1810919 RepID=A0A3D8T6C5_9EURO|nr:putative Zn(II)2Cys6 transcription factor [Aspergillus mulundensis]RDW93991.1 putative Zn(II)2Cys6 transcription factor [Aspergillus mulundensis]